MTDYITKICTKCKTEKEIQKFRYRKVRNYYISVCKECENVYNKKYRKEHLEYFTNYDKSEKRKKYKQKYWLENKETIEEYREENKDKYRKYFRERANVKRKNDLNYRISNNLRSRLNSAIKNNYKTGSAVTDLGCTIEQFKFYLESKFQSGMTWNNYGEWHIDHIKPLSKFDLTIREQLVEACDYKNLQPLWAQDNIRKSNKIEEKIYVGNAT